MALKKKITKDEFDKLADVLKAEYKADGDAYVLDVDGDEDTGALKRAKDREKQRADEAEKKSKELENQLQEALKVDPSKRADIEALQKSWEKKLETQKGEYDGKLSNRDNFIKKQLIDATAGKLAGEISTVPALMAKAIRERLSVDFEGDEPTLRILDGAGKISALTTDDLKKEFLTNKEYASIIVASKATGGRTPVKPLGGADDKPVIAAKMNPKDLAARIKEQKEQNQS